MVRLSLLGLSLVILLTGCNLGGGARETAAPLNPTATTAPIQSGKPVVTILSPQDNTDVTVGKQLLINVSATDSVGVTGIQLLVNGAVVKRISSTSISGDKTLPAILDYTPRIAGDLNVQVLAFRGSTPSDAAALSLNAVTAGSTGGSTGGNTGGTGGIIPVVIPNDGVCRVLTDVNLNLRATPITGSVLTIIPGNTLAVVTSRLSDNSWWKISYNNTQGWVSGQFVSLSGNCSNIGVDAPATPTLAPTLTSFPKTATPFPTAMPTPVPGKADLLVTQIGGEQNPVRGGSDVTKQYSVTITNNGMNSAGQFTVSLKVNDVLSKEWTVSGLSAGQSVLLTTDVTFKAAGSAILRVDADTTNSVVEASDVNNTGFYTVTVQP